MARTGIRVADLLDETVFRETLARNLEEKNIYSAVDPEGARARPRDDSRRLPALRDDARAVRHRHRALPASRARGRRARALRGRARHAPRRRPRHVSVRDVVEHRRRRGLRRRRPRAARGFDEIIGICKAYTTRVGSGPFPTEELGAIGQQPARERRRVRLDDRPPAPLRLVRRRPRPLRRAPERPHRPRPHQARRADRRRSDSRLPRVSRRRRTLRGRAGEHRPALRGGAGVRGARRLDRAAQRGASASRICRRTPAATSIGSRS